MNVLVSVSDKNTRLLNMFTAIFVEETMEAAKLNEELIQRNEARENARTAKALENLEKQCRPSGKRRVF